MACLGVGGGGDNERCANGSVMYPGEYPLCSAVLGDHSWCISSSSSLWGWNSSISASWRCFLALRMKKNTSAPRTIAPPTPPTTPPTIALLRSLRPPDELSWDDVGDGVAEDTLVVAESVVVGSVASIVGVTMSVVVESVQSVVVVVS